MDFVFTLHSHLPYVLNHGRWPHGSDWICEAAIDTYLPLLDAFRALERDSVPAPVTIGFTPVLANQLAHPTFVAELEAFFEQRLEACKEAPVALTSTGDAHLVPLVAYWVRHLLHLRTLFRSIDGDLIGAFRALEQAGRLEIIGSAATHGFLPLLGRDESIRLQLATGIREHRRLFGRLPSGCWLPECAYRPRGEWAPWPTARVMHMRRGIEEHIADAGFQFFFVDAHLAAAGRAPSFTGDPHTERPERFPDPALAREQPVRRTPYRTYRLPAGGHRESVAAFVRDPRASAQVWSRNEGYPGDGAYLEFHKIRWPGGLKFWRVTGPGVDLGEKAPYDPAAALDKSRQHAGHFASLLEGIAVAHGDLRDGVIAAPFDTELFGHWWYEGPEFLAETYRALRGQRDVRPVSGTGHLAKHPATEGIRLPPGSWGANGDWSMWLSEQTAWTWERLWPLEDAFWDAATDALGRQETRPILEQAARSLLLAQSSDWQFIISTGAVPDYAVRRFEGHCEDTERLIAALRPDGNVEEGHRLAAELAKRDDVFPDILPAIQAALNGSRSLVGR